MGFHHADQAGLDLLNSGDPPISASQSAGITGMSHHTWPELVLFICFTDLHVQAKSLTILVENLIDMADSFWETSFR